MEQENGKEALSVLSSSKTFFCFVVIKDEILCTANLANLHRWNLYSIVSYFKELIFDIVLYTFAIYIILYHVKILHNFSF